MSAEDMRDEADAEDGLKPTPLPKIFRDFASQFESFAKGYEAVAKDGSVTADSEQVKDIQNAVLSIRRARHVIGTTLLAISAQTGAAAVKRLMAVELAKALRARPDFDKAIESAAVALEELGASFPAGIPGDDWVILDFEIEGIAEILRVNVRRSWTWAKARAEALLKAGVVDPDDDDESYAIYFGDVDERVDADSFVKDKQVKTGDIVELCQ